MEDSERSSFLVFPPAGVEFVPRGPEQDRVAILYSFWSGCQLSGFRKGCYGAHGADQWEEQAGSLSSICSHDQWRPSRPME